MKDVLYIRKGSDKAPQGGGDTRSWLFYYKLRAGEDSELSVPGPDRDYDKTTEVKDEPEAGDRLWFILDELIVGVVPVLRVMFDDLNNRNEYWYNGIDLYEISITLNETTRAQIQDGSLWKQLSRPQFSSSGPAMNGS